MADPVLAIDLGGTLTRVAVVRGGDVLDRAEAPTARNAGPERWLQDVAGLARPFLGRFGQVGMTVTGLVQAGRWRAMNPATLAIPDGFDLGGAAQAIFGLMPTLANDAQAAAFAEWRFGAGAV